MDSYEINRILSQDSYSANFFSGVYSADNIPLLEHHSSIIVNSDISSSPGTHWLAFYSEDGESLEFFDSYGNPPEFFGEYFLEACSKYKSVSWNKKEFQSPTSNVCGAYCIYYTRRRCQGHSMYSILNELSLNKKNDFRMYQFVKKRYGVKMIFKK